MNWSPKILIVDDDRDSVRLLAITLKNAGYSDLISTTDPRQALSQYDEMKPDLMLMDLMMPSMDGMSLMEAIQNRTSTDNYVPIVVVSSDGGAESQQRALSTGARDFITKPFDRTDVVLRVRNLLDARFRYLQSQNRTHVLEEKVREQSADLESAQVECLQRLAKAAEFHDDATGQHNQRVGHLAGLLGEEMGFSQERVHLLRDAASLHDIGKIGIPDRILRKPGKLTSDEFDRIKEHTRIGAEILAGSHFPVLALAEEVAFYHHERWNGTGYNGVAGKNIPLAARIVSLADTFDVLTHHRPYRTAWSGAEAVAEILRERERQFDPCVVDVFTSSPWIHYLCTVRLDLLTPSLSIAEV